MAGFRNNFRKKLFIGFFVIFAITFFGVHLNVRAETIEDLRKSIDQKNQEIQKLETEIKKSKDELKTTQTRGATLKAEIARLNNEIKKLTNDITLTGRQIERKTLEIQSLGLEIEQKEQSIGTFRRGLGGLVQTIFENDRVPLITLFLKYESFSDFLRFFGYADLIQQKIVDSVQALRVIQNELTEKRSATQTKKKELADLSQLLHARVTAEAAAKTEQSTLLTITKNQEKTYQELIKVQEDRRKAMESEIRDIEAKIRITIDPSLLPSRGHGILGSPLPDLVLGSCWQGSEAFKNCITQYFGYTDFAAVGSYGGKGHNGVDFRADIGTPVYSAENGVVAGAGDTDTGCRRASYGKWILIKHTNNLSTIYGHLSAVNVLSGQSVKRGDQIAVSGQTGYATGPHLHFGVYASQAVSVESIRSKVCGRMMTLPISAINGYLNPLDYL